MSSRPSAADNLFLGDSFSRAATGRWAFPCPCQRREGSAAALVGRLRNAAFVVAAPLAFLFQPVSAQVPTADVTGRVQDVTGGGIAGVRIQLRNSAKASIATASSSAQGRLTLAKVPAGAYTLIAESAGFESLRKETTVSPRGSK